MSILLLLRLALVLVSALLTLSCASVGTGGEDDNTGDLGAVQEKRPGDVYAELGQQYMTEGQPEIALRKLKRGLDVDPDNARIHAVLGLLYQRLGENGPAQRHFARASSLEPKNPYYRNAWGSFLCLQKDYAEAEKQFRLALENPLYRQPWAASTNAGLCAFQAGESSKAEDYLRRALTANPRIPQALLTMSRVSLEKGATPQAKRYLERYRALAPHTPETLLLGLRIEHALGSRDGMERYLVVLKNRYPDAPETRTALELKQP